MSRVFGWIAASNCNWRTLAVCLLWGSVWTAPSEAATLSSLLGGGSLMLGNSQFSQWELVHVDTTGAGIDLSQIQVNPLGSNPQLPSIQFVGGTQLATAGMNAVEMILRYRVDSLAGSNTFTGQTLELNSLTFGGTGEIALVTSEFNDGVATDLGSTVVMADHAANVTLLSDSEAFAAKSQVWVTMDIYVAGTAAGDSVVLGSFVQRLAQTGPPGTPGDYNQNGIVDAADYTVWRDHLGAPAGTLANDVNGGVIGTAQYNTWRANFGMAGSAALAAAAVPEPGTLLLTMLAAAACAPIRRRRWRTRTAIHGFTCPPRPG